MTQDNIRMYDEGMQLNLVKREIVQLNLKTKDLIQVS